MSVIRRRRGSHSLLAAAVVMIAGGSVSAGEDVVRVNACTLLDAGELSAVLQSPVGVGERHDSGFVKGDERVPAGTYSSTCLWRLGAAGAPAASEQPALATGSYVILNVLQWPRGSGGARRFLDEFIEAAKDGTIDHTPVRLSIAEGGLWWGDGVAAFKADTSFGISVHLVGRRSGERDAEEALARTIAARL
jgi:hypothetical protein